MATNHLGPFLLTMLLLPCLQSSNSQVHFTSSLGSELHALTVHSIMRDSSPFYGLLHVIAHSQHDYLYVCLQCVLHRATPAKLDTKLSDACRASRAHRKLADIAELENSIATVNISAEICSLSSCGFVTFMT